MIAFARRQLRIVALAVGAMMTVHTSCGAQQPAPSPDSVAVAARAIPHGTVLTADDITYVERSASPRVVGADTTRVQPGWVARRLVNAGEPLRGPAVSAPIVLTANQPVDVVYSDHDIQITIRGVVTRDAALGDRVTVRTSNGHHLDGIVTGPGRVRIE